MPRSSRVTSALQLVNSPLGQDPAVLLMQEGALCSA
jgi:hypothetical protein